MKPRAAQPPGAPAANEWRTLWEVLREEYASLRPAWATQLPEVDLKTPPEERKKQREKVARLFACAHRPPDDKPLSALCLSGGGIRSATFNLGVIQGLAERGLLEKFDYLSSVSGGGYIASWLSAWLKRADADMDKSRSAVFEALGQSSRPPPNPLHPEPSQVRHLRRYSNYLTPRLGALSLDTWTSMAIVVRNLFLNWLVFIPILAAALALPLLAIASWGSFTADGQCTLTDWRVFALGGVALPLSMASGFLMHVLRANTQSPRDSQWWAKRPVPMVLVPMGLATIVLAIGVDYGAACDIGFTSALIPSAVWSMLAPAVAFLWASRVQRTAFGVTPVAKTSDLLALFAAGAVQAVTYAGMWSHWGGLRDWRFHAFVILIPALVLVPALFAKMLFVGFASIAESKDDQDETRYRATEYGDAQREWWARWSAWIAVAVAAWTGLASLVYLAPWIVETLLSWAYGQVVAWTGTLSLGYVLSKLGASSRTPGKSDATDGWMQAVVAWGVPLFCVLLAVLLSYGTQALLAWIVGSELRGEAIQLPAWQIVLAILALLGVGIGTSYFVNVNRFSLQAFYRNRLVRAYLGASRQMRTPNWFTGFDPDDNVRLADLEKNRPLPVVNMALNLVGGGELAWQERRAESFTATPLHCGSASVDYCQTAEYAGQQGMSLGTAVAISGAAANPNMGSNSSPAVGFLMTLFNARLGAWLPNPGREGEGVHQKGGPWQWSWFYSLAEAFGWTNDTATFVNLSDGGHFENLAMYEMVRRRCRTIVVCDAGQDGHCRFDDLGNAIRKIRIDFGIPITFQNAIRIVPKDQPDPHAGYCAIGTIHYGEVDPGAPSGTLVYLKPALSGDEPYDVYNYAKASPDFPHETTADQWFSESQFESYRALGHTAVLAISGAGATDLAAFARNVKDYLDRRSGAGRRPSPGGTASGVPTVPIDDPDADVDGVAIQPPLPGGGPEPD